MSALFVTFADLGKKSNLKTGSILPLIKKFQKEDQLSGVICRINAGSKIKNTRGSISLIFHYILKIIEKISFKKFHARSFEEKLIDKKATRIKTNADVVFFHPEYFYHKSVSSLKSRGKKTIGIATMAHLKTNARLEEEEFTKFNVPKENARDRRFKTLDKNFKNDFDYIIAFSDFVKESYVSNGFPEKNILTVYSDVDRQIFSRTREKSDSIFRIIYSAHIRPLKGLHYLLEAFENLKLENAELVIVGDFPNMPKEFISEYKKIIDKNPKIKTVGKIYRSEIINYYENSSLLVFPSLTEGNSKVILEAMSMGLPVITTKNSKSLVQDGENGYIIPIRDSSAIAEKILYLYENQDLLKKMGDKSLEIMNQKTPFSDQVFEIYSKIVNTQ